MPLGSIRYARCSRLMRHTAEQRRANLGFVLTVVLRHISAHRKSTLIRSSQTQRRLRLRLLADELEISRNRRNRHDGAVPRSYENTRKQLHARTVDGAWHHP